MILVVDDDEATLEEVCAVLTDAGLAVRSATSAAAALAIARTEIPELVVSDIVMPEIDGLALRCAYVETYPERETPFLFLSSIDDPRTIVRGLELGAEDYLVKPADERVLCAKVKSILRRRLRRAGRSFRGDLASLPMPRLLRFCETSGLTGYLDVFVPDGVRTVRFRSGQLDDADASAHLGELLALGAGAFQLQSVPIDFGSLDGAGRTSPLPIMNDDLPRGRISGIRLERRLLQIQTELVGGAEPLIVTLVTVEGRSTWKQRSAVPPGLDGAAVQERIDRQHAEIEAQVEGKLATALTSEPGPAPAAEFNRQFDAGYDRFRAGDYAGAVDCWQAALRADPASSAAANNLKIARERLGT